MRQRSDKLPTPPLTRPHKGEGKERQKHDRLRHKNVIAELTAKMLIEVEAVRFMTDQPFIFTSGWASPVYTDCRRLISFPRVRRQLIDFGAETLARDVGFEQFDLVAGGETAGIPFAAWMAEQLMLPMQYVRKKPKGFRPQRADRRPSGARRARAPGRGHDHRRPQQGQFLQRAARGWRHHRALLRSVFLRHLSRGPENPRRSRRHLARARHLVERSGGGQEERPLRQRPMTGRRDLHERSGQLVEGAWRRRSGRGVKVTATARRYRVMSDE